MFFFSFSILLFQPKHALVWFGWGFLPARFSSKNYWLFLLTIVFYRDGWVGNQTFHDFLFVLFFSFSERKVVGV